jgi:peptidoglycan/LPS O-acetylase OafA/YrhL
MIGLSGLQQLPLVAERTVREVTDLPDFLTHLFLVHNLWPDHIVRISGPFWSIALECQLYVLFPLLLVLMKRPWVPMAGAVAVAGAWWLASPHLLGPSPFNVEVGTGQGDAAFAYWNSLPSLLPLFVLGMGAAWMLAGPRRIPTWTAPAGLSLLVAAIFVDNFVAWPVAGKLVAAGATALMLLLPSRRIGRFLCWRPLVRVGEASYTLYLIHYPFMALMWKLSAAYLHGPVLVLACLAVVASSVLVALVLSKVIEQPFQRQAWRLARPA